MSEIKMIVEATISETWMKIIKQILWYGKFVNDERGSKTIEKLNIVSKILDPLEFKRSFNLSNLTIPVNCKWSVDKLNIYKEQFLDKNNPGFVYTYGNRLRDYEGNDQVQHVINRLNNNMNSRRAVSVTWKPYEDYINEDVPCLILVDFKIRDGELNTTALWRSHDIYGAWFPNVVGLTHLAQYITKNLEENVMVGTITVHSISAHIYEHDILSAKKLVGMI